MILKIKAFLIRLLSPKKPLELPQPSGGTHVSEMELKSSPNLTKIYKLSKDLSKSKTLERRVTISFDDGSYVDLLVYAPYTLKVIQSHSQTTVERKKIGWA